MRPVANDDPPIVKEDLFFSAGAYRLHGQLAYAEDAQCRGAVVCAGPHPLLGGNMRNNVVQGLADGLAQRGLLTLRFDYRGIGRSQGPAVDVARHLAEFWRTSHISDEIDFGHDVQGAVDFVEQSARGLPLVLAGYSFGCVPLPYIRSQAGPTALVLIAPTVSKHNYDAFTSVSCPLLVVASEEDFATDSERLDNWFGGLTMPRQLVRQRCDNHFFRGHEAWLVDVVAQFLGRPLRGTNL